MRNRIVLMLLCLLPPLWAQQPAAVQKKDSVVFVKRGNDRWFAKDKADHFLVSAFLTGCGYYAARQEEHRSHADGIRMAVGFSLSLGVVKELYDGLSGRGQASWKDLIADVAGTGCGYAICVAGR